MWWGARRRSAGPGSEANTISEWDASVQPRSKVVLYPYELLKYE